MSAIMVHLAASKSGIQQSSKTLKTGVSGFLMKLLQRMETKSPETVTLSYPCNTEKDAQKGIKSVLLKNCPALNEEKSNYRGRSELFVG